MRTVFVTLSAMLALTSCGSVNDQALGAAVSAGTAAVLWVAAKGCESQGCTWGSYCDDQTGRCVTRTCADGCPSGSYCNASIDRCEDMPAVTRMPPPSDPPSADQRLQRVQPLVIPSY